MANGMAKDGKLMAKDGKGWQKMAKDVKRWFLIFALKDGKRWQRMARFLPSCRALDVGKVGQLFICSNSLTFSYRKTFFSSFLFLKKWPKTLLACSGICVC